MNASEDIKLTKFDHLLLVGDLNFDLRCESKFGFIEIFNLSCLMKDPTCFAKAQVHHLLMLCWQTPNLYVLEQDFFVQVSVIVMT